MALPNVFSRNVSDGIIQRINQLKSSSEPQWGKMDVAKMLAHCNVTYEMAFTEKHPKPNFFVKFMLKTFVKNSVVNEMPYKRNSSTAPQFIMKSEKNFETEKALLVAHIQQAQQLGESHFDGIESHSFGKLSKSEWNNMFYKHLEHHLHQFGV